jgi:PPM family protein phosphatase
VGESGLKVAIFRGVNSSLGPLRFSQVEVSSDLDVSDLTEAARSQVRGGITASSRADADNIVSRLSDQLLPVCPAPGSSSSPSASASPSDTAGTSPATAGGTTSGAATPGSSPAAATTPADPGATASASPSPTGGTSTRTRSSATPQPGVDCRVSR